MVYPAYCVNESDKGQDSFRALMRYLMIVLAPLLSGRKPSVLFNLRNIAANERASFMRNWEKCKVQAALVLRISFYELKKNERITQVFCYRHRLLREVFCDRKKMRFLRERGFDVYSGMDFVLKEMFHRMERGRDFPHEIGVLLGYPLDDVKGFIQDKYAFNKKGLWKTYGQDEKSVELMQSMRDAEKRMRFCLTGNVDYLEVVKREEWMQGVM